MGCVTGALIVLKPGYDTTVRTATLCAVGTVGGALVRTADVAAGSAIAIAIAVAVIVLRPMQHRDVEHGAASG